ncbi:4'-phosphopantetheinyl transferase [Arthrobacter sp. UYCu512]|uniref:4'-phosphopantetheinyl transferase family protein n=1 Tax=Arthrobacter sp. UYCu512 TaxID=3156338 RepID=UPI0033931E6D
MAFLDQAERARAAGLKDDPTRRDFVAGRIALRAFAAGILAVHPGELTAAYVCPDCGTGPENDHGRPGYRIAGLPAGLNLSLSRSHGWALLAAVHTREPGVRPGIDLEHSSGVTFPGFDVVALTPAERERLNTLTPDQATRWRAAAWARKEALLKSRGTGLRVDPATVEAFAEPGDGIVLIELDTFALGLPAGFAAALAVPGTA